MVLVKLEAAALEQHQRHHGGLLALGLQPVLLEGLVDGVDGLLGGAALVGEGGVGAGGGFGVDGREHGGG